MKNCEHICCFFCDAVKNPDYCEGYCEKIETGETQEAEQCEWFMKPKGCLND